MSVMQKGMKEKGSKRQINRNSSIKTSQGDKWKVSPSWLKFFLAQNQMRRREGVREKERDADDS